MASEPKDYTIMILTSNTEVLKIRSSFVYLNSRVKGDFQAIVVVSNKFELLGRKKTTTKQYTLFKRFLCDIL